MWCLIGLCHCTPTVSMGYLLEPFHHPKLPAGKITAVESDLPSVGMHGDAQDDAGGCQQALGGRAFERNPPQIVAVLRFIRLEQDGLAVCRPRQAAEASCSNTPRNPV